MLLCQCKLHMKPTTSSPCFVIQQCQVHQIFVFYVFYCNLKEKDHIRRNVNSKKKELFTCEISIIILICKKLGLFGPVQQKIKLPSPYIKFQEDQRTLFF